MSNYLSKLFVKGAATSIIAASFMLGFVACDFAGCSIGGTSEEYKANLKIKVSSIDPKIGIEKETKNLPTIVINKTPIKFKTWGDVDLEEMDIRKDYVVSANEITIIRQGKTLSCNAKDVHIPANSVKKGEMHAVNVQYKCAPNQ
jgi:hypothetical protein